MGGVVARPFQPGRKALLVRGPYPMPPMLLQYVVAEGRRARMSGGKGLRGLCEAAEGHRSPTPLVGLWVTLSVSLRDATAQSDS